MFKSERREIKRRNQRKMRVEGKSVFVIAEAQKKRDAKQRKQNRENKAWAGA
jgi:hypothetical protein